ncbi:serine dehydratase subunit alpha family protein [Moorella sp. Hama-1]|uniref:L-cysteine desulfidase family protein n=1 Tax=Moorella sp. Hama-1 TaxID=2138101 RepID=UPI00137AA4A0|nr:L-serine ammonia-lyase, iron-sulfur-dependent, subunit alpha [Moorella sp. Hama-1]BCV21695.1 UPF0597 protein [Moorella sp. Hama-1]
MLDQRSLINLLHQEADIAVGCTEPVMVALAAAKAREILGILPQMVDISVSSAVWKNARRVGLPGTAEKGLAMAAAMGLLAPVEAGQRLLAYLTPDQVQQAKKFILEGTIKVRVIGDKEGLYTRALATSKQHEVIVELKGNHKNFAALWLDGQLIGRQGEHLDLQLEALLAQDSQTLLKQVLSLPTEEINFLYQGANEILAFAREVEQGMREPLSSLVSFFRRPGTEVGGLAEQARTFTGIAVAERMAGATYPVLTCAGSGNQGILAAVPLLLMSQNLGADPKKITRALAVAHFTNMYLRAYTGKLSPLCGAVTGGAGVAAAICWLLGGSHEQIINAMQIILGNLCCIICDGAKESCALKISTAAVEAVRAGFMASQGAILESGTGIVGKKLEDTMELVRKVYQGGLGEIDYYLGKVDYLLSAC